MMEKIDIKKAKTLAEKKGVKPGRLKGGEGVALIKGETKTLTPITWGEFEELLTKRGLAIYESGGYLRIMKDKKAE